MRSIMLVRAAEGGAFADLEAAEAQALVFDLEAEAPLEAARGLQGFLRDAQVSEHRPLLFVRLPTLDLDGIDDVLAVLLREAPDGIWLRGCTGGRDVQHLGVKLAVHEAANDLTEGEIAIIAEAGSTAPSVFAFNTFPNCSRRLLALAWNPAELAAELGFHGEGNAEAPSPLRTARDLLILAARAADVSAIDWSRSGLSDTDFKLDCEKARRDGFNAKLVTSAGQAAIVNAVYDRSG